MDGRESSTAEQHAEPVDARRADAGAPALGGLPAAAPAALAEAIGRVAPGRRGAVVADISRAYGNRFTQTLARSLQIARDPVDTKTEEVPATDIWAGTLVQQIVVSLVRKRVGFQTRVGMIMGKVTTDLKPGHYKLKLEADKKRWLITEPAVKSGWRFEVELEGADPWTLSYPEEIPMLVVAGSLQEPKTFGDMLGPDGQLKDPLWLHENLPPELKPKPIAGIDDFESVHYDIDYRSEKGGLSKWLILNYRDGTSKEVNIDSITDATPKLMAAKQDVLKIMDDYNALFILGAFPAVFFILTMAPTVSVPGRTGGGTVRRTQVPKQGGGGQKSQGGTKTENIGPKSESTGPKTGPKTETPAAKVEAPSFSSQQQTAQDLAGGMAAKGEKVVVNLGGAGAKHEPQGAINVNNQAVARKDIPNLVQADGSRVGDLFKPGTVDRIEGHNMAPGAVDWAQAAPGAFKALKPGGRLQYYYRGANADAKAAEAALKSAGFKDVKNVSDVLITATKPGG